MKYVIDASKGDPLILGYSCSGYKIAVGNAVPVKYLQFARFGLADSATNLTRC